MSTSDSIDVLVLNRASERFHGPPRTEEMHPTHIFILMGQHILQSPFIIINPYIMGVHIPRTERMCYVSYVSFKIKVDIDLIDIFSYVIVTGHSSL